MQQKADIRLNLEPNRRSLQIEFGAKGNKLVGFSLEAPEIDRLIGLLGVARAQMLDAVPATLDPGSRVPATLAPAWRLPATASRAEHGLILRHPGFGWLGFVLSPAQARSLSQALAARIPAEVG